MSLLLNAAYLPLAYPYFWWHKFVTNKYGEDITEKLGYVPKRNGEKKCLWLHAVSVGETLASRTVAEAFSAAHPEWDLRVSTTSATGREVAQKYYGANRVVYYPLDPGWMVRRTFDRLRPNLIVLMELEVWPNFMEEAERRNVPVIVANARITDRSARGFKRFDFMTKKMLRRVSLWLAQSEEYASRLKSLGINEDKIVVAGSVKYDTVPTEIDESIKSEYRSLFGANKRTKLIVAGSTHPTEEESVLKAFSFVRDRLDSAIRLVLVPRHPERLDEVERLCENYGGSIRKSKITDEMKALPSIILVDTMGELEKIYCAADVVFVGGTLIEHGGQNMMEPCGLGKPVIIGPSVYNFAEAAGILRECGGIREMASKEELPTAIENLLVNAAKANEMGNVARNRLLTMKGATARTIECLQRFM